MVSSVEKTLRPLTQGLSRSSQPMCLALHTIFLNILYLKLPPLFTNFKSTPPSPINQASVHMSYHSRLISYLICNYCISCVVILQFILLICIIKRNFRPVCPIFNLHHSKLHTLHYKTLSLFA